MNFFEHQEVARRNTKRLVFLFLLATIAIVVSLDAIVAVVFANLENPDPHAGWVFPDTAWLASHLRLMLISSLAILVFILGTSAIKIASLRGGGASVAQSLGGTLVEETSGDPALQRLRNVVEEMAIASGVPVPEIYVLEAEDGINAFAAGFTPGDAAIGVTRGTVDQLTRDELQGVIAHEYSHILNGDMRLNMNLIGVLHGILLIGATGSAIVRGFSRSRLVMGGRRDRDNGQLVLVILGVGAGLFVIGSIGVFFGRLIKAGVSRQREFLADASAVQFTRDSGGISGALKKIGGFEKGSELDRASEEVSHMLFGAGQSFLSGWARTHPPLVDRIRAIDPTFDAEEWHAAIASSPPGMRPVAGVQGFDTQTPLDLEPERVAESVGTPTAAHLEYAAGILQNIPPSIHAALGYPSAAQGVVFALLLSEDAPTQQQQLRSIDAAYGAEFAREVGELGREVDSVSRSTRLPLADLALPQLRRLGPGRLAAFSKMVVDLIEADRRVDFFEFGLWRMLRTHLTDASAGRPRPRNLALADCTSEIQALLSAVAVVGASDAKQAADAYASGLLRLPGSMWPDFAHPKDWMREVDGALERLDGLRQSHKRHLVEALVAVADHDQHVTADESEFLRAVCANLHCPLPPLAVQGNRP